MSKVPGGRKRWSQIPEEPDATKKSIGAGGGHMTLKSGLCMACARRPSCAFPEDAGLPVLECDEFRGKLLPLTLDRTALIPAEFRGLCVSCMIRETCSQEKPEEGVWHCENYI